MASNCRRVAFAGAHPHRFQHVEHEDLARAEAVIAAVAQAANNGQIGAGKVFVLDVLEAVRVRTGERNAAAI